MTTIPDDEATTAILACKSIPELARLTVHWRATGKTISQEACKVMNEAQRTLVAGQ